MKNHGTEKLNEMLKQKLIPRHKWDIPLCRWYYINNAVHYELPRRFLTKDEKTPSLSSSSSPSSPPPVPVLPS